ncbi:MAG: polysaccharide deacetylase family protein [Devosia sp.]
MHSDFTLMDRVANRVARTLPTRRIPIDLARPIVSFTFDDVPATARSNGAAILERYGARGTFYASGGLAGREHDGVTVMDEADYRDLVLRGHEIGNHTYSHLRPLQLGPDFGRDLDRNEAFLARVMPLKARNFAYPFGLSSPFARSEMRRFRSARGTHLGINRGSADLDNLAAVELRPAVQEAELCGWLDAAIESPGWLIYFTHDVSDAPSAFGCRPAVLEAVIRRASESVCEILTIDAALDRLGVAP